MGRRTTRTKSRRHVPAAGRPPHPDAHDYQYDQQRGCCRHCPLPRSNAIHDPAAVAARAALAAAASERVAAAQAEHQRRTGESS